NVEVVDGRGEDEGRLRPGRVGDRARPGDPVHRERRAGHALERVERLAPRDRHGGAVGRDRGGGDRRGRRVDDEGARRAVARGRRRRVLRGGAPVVRAVGEVRGGRDGGGAVRAVRDARGGRERRDGVARRGAGRGRADLERERARVVRIRIGERRGERRGRRVRAEPVGRRDERGRRRRGVGRVVRDGDAGDRGRGAAGRRVAEREDVEVVDGRGEREGRLRVGARVGDRAGAGDAVDRERGAGDGLARVERLRPGDRDARAVRADRRRGDRRRGGVDGEGAGRAVGARVARAVDVLRAPEVDAVGRDRAGRNTRRAVGAVRDRRRGRVEGRELARAVADRADLEGDLAEVVRIRI